MHLQMPFGGPGWVKHEVFEGVSGKAIFRVQRIMGQLIDQGICLIRYPFPIPVDI